VINICCQNYDIVHSIDRIKKRVMKLSADEKWLLALQHTSDTESKYWPYKGRPVSTNCQFCNAAMECEFIIHKSTHKANHYKVGHRVSTTDENFYVLLLTNHCTVLEQF